MTVPFGVILSIVLSCNSSFKGSKNMEYCVKAARACASAEENKNLSAKDIYAKCSTAFKE